MLIFERANFKICGDWNSIYEEYKKYVKKNSLVLEIGASRVNTTKLLAIKCKKVIGVEYFKERTPKNFDNVSYLNISWEELSKFIKTKSIDLAVSTHVLEHVKNDLKAINELYKVLKPNGVALINTPNRMRLTRRIIETFLGKKKFPDLASEHQREYIEEDLIKLLKKSKFKRYKIKPVVFGLHGGSYYFYSDKIPKLFYNYCNFWEIKLIK